MQLIKAFHTKASINGLSKRVIVSIEVDPDLDIDLSDFDADDRERYALAIQRGELTCLWVKVTARFSDLAHYEGIDTL